VKSPTLLVSWTIAFLVIIAGLLIGIAAFDAEWTSRFVDTIAAYVPKILGAALVLVGTVIARFLSRSVLIGAVNMNFEYGRLLSVGVKWLVIVLAVAMALEHLRIGSGIVELAFGILFGGIVLALALDVADALQDDLLGGLGRDATEVVRGVVPLADDLALLVELLGDHLDVTGLDVDLDEGVVTLGGTVLVQSIQEPAVLISPPDHSVYWSLQN